MADTDQKTQEATPERRRSAREKGQIPYSAELVQGALLLAGVATLWIGVGVSDGLKLSMRGGLTDIRTDLDTAAVRVLALEKLIELGRTVGPLLISVMLTVLAVGGLQAGGSISLTALMPDAGRLSPARGISRLWSSRSMMRTLVSLLKVTVVVAIAAAVGKAQFGMFSSAGRGSLATALTIGWNASTAIAIAVAGSMTVVGVLDLLYQRWKHEQDLKMSLQEVKEDHKQQEGDPMVRARLRKLQRERANNSMMKAVPDATVIVTNPTHISVALKYDRETMAAPTILAMGADALAMRIRLIAREHGVPIVEQKVVARALFETAQVGEEIPLILYKAIAEILSGVLRPNR